LSRLPDLLWEATLLVCLLLQYALARCILFKPYFRRGMMKIVLFSLAILILLSGIYIFVQFKKFSSVVKGTKIANYDNCNKALLVIDLQNTLTEKDGKAIINLEQTDEVIRHVNGYYQIC
jgi:hypothetical protein